MKRWITILISILVLAGSTMASPYDEHGNGLPLVSCNPFVWGGGWAIPQDIFLTVVLQDKTNHRVGFSVNRKLGGYTKLYICGTCGGTIATDQLTIENISGQFKAQVIVSDIYAEDVDWSNIVSVDMGLCPPSCASGFSIVSAQWHDNLGSIYSVTPNGNLIPYPNTQNQMASLVLGMQMTVTDPLASRLHVQLANDSAFTSIFYDNVFPVSGQTTPFTVTVNQFAAMYFRCRTETDAGGGMSSTWCDGGGTFIRPLTPSTQLTHSTDCIQNMPLQMSLASISAVTVGAVQTQPQGYQMPTINFNNNVLAAARRLKDARTGPTSIDDTGKRFSSALLSEYENRAVRDMIRANYQQLQNKIATLFPEYMKISASTNLIAGTSYASIPIPSDCWYATDVSYANYSGKFYRVPQDRIETVKNGQDPLIVPSTTRPVWWQENNLICVLPASLSSAIIIRYLKVHQDIQPIIGMNAAGDYLTSGSPTFTLATNTLSGGTYHNGGFTNADINKLVIFRDTTPYVYIGQIASVNSANSVVLYGYGLPTGNVTVADVIKPDYLSVPPDLQINPSWYGEIIDRMVAFGEADRKNGVVQ